MTYIFLSIKPKLLVRTFSAGLILMFMVYYLFDISAWLIPIVVTAAHLMVICLSIGNVNIKQQNQSIKIVSANLFKSVSLRSPVTVQRWWCYDFNITDAEEGPPSQGEANDLHVFLRLRDEQGVEVIFTEYIGFDTRFPNECPHAYQPISSDQIMFRVQRTDRLFAFLGQYLKDGLIETPISPAS